MKFVSLSDPSGCWHCIQGDKELGKGLSAIALLSSEVLPTIEKIIGKCTLQLIFQHFARCGRAKFKPLLCSQQAEASQASPLLEAHQFGIGGLHREIPRTQLLFALANTPFST